MTAPTEWPGLARRLFFDDDPPEGLEWVAALSPRNMRVFAVELSAALAAATPEHIAELLDAWRATAELDQAPEIRAEIDRNRRGPQQPLDSWPNARTA